MSARFDRRAEDGEAIVGIGEGNLCIRVEGVGGCVNGIPVVGRGPRAEK